MEEFSTAVLDSDELLRGGVEDLVLENRASGRRWARMVEIHTRQIPTGGSFAMSAREWTTLRITEAWGYNDSYARRELNVALFLEQNALHIWEMVLAGELDHYRAALIADMVRTRDNQRFLRRHRRDFPDLDAGRGVSLVMCTTKQLRNKLNYEIRLALQEEDDDFDEKHAQREVRTVEFDDGMGQLAIGGSVDEVRLARHRLHAAAKQKRSEGDTRTVEQLMSDLALDLLIGRTEEVPVPHFSRPIINVTVSWQTLAGIREDPGKLSGGDVIPADLARLIATKEGATWYRLLTDAENDDQPLQLSTDSYKPTAALWRHTMAFYETCTHENCDRPAVACELDHDEEWPHGRTCPENIRPRCKRHHKCKHARAELRRLDLEWEYSMVFEEAA